MGEITRQPARAIQNALIDSVLAGLCALIVFGPIVGVVLKGYGFTLAPARVAILVAVVMAGRLALSLLLQSHRGKAFIARFEGADDGVYVRPPGYRSRLRWIIPLLVGLAIVFPFLATKYLLTVAILGLIYVLLGLGLNIVVGLAGLLDLGYVAFYAIGAYGLALGYQYLGLGFWAMLPLGAVMAALAGALLGFPVLRMHGDYLAIVTLGFGEIIRLVLNNWVSFTGGPNGVNGVLMTFGQDPRTLPDGKAVIEKFRASGFEPEGYTLYAYASIQAIAAAWNAVGTDNAKASDWLKSHDVETVMGKKAWDGKGDLKVSDYVVYQWDDKGKYHQL
ncbi:branched-chain amino acid transport system permease LivM [Klebsiella pneumoniae]|nr:branched-chain amino acid transport system permease LivM [Klebsiella pneumoniae]